MSWSSLGLFEISPDWRFSAPTEGNFFRVRSTLSGLTPFLFRGLIAQGVNGNPPTLIDLRRVWAVPGEGISFEFPRRDFLPIARSIALKRTGKYTTPIVWTVYLDVWNG